MANYNGLRAKVMVWEPKAERYKVCFDDGTEALLKAKNLSKESAMRKEVENSNRPVAPRTRESDHARARNQAQQRVAGMLIPSSSEESESESEDEGADRRFQAGVIGTARVREQYDGDGENFWVLCTNYPLVTTVCG